MKKVLILMSTYNGEKYIKEQIDSIENQDYLSLSLLVRDDGSTDATLSILKEYEKKFENITVIQGENIGVWKSFFELCKMADGQADYYALADQDDYWFPDKISAAIEYMKRGEKEKGLLYAGNKTLVDKELQLINSEIDYSYECIPSFGNALVENICTGCTCVLNQELLKIICRHIPSYVIMHDWWIYLIASALGKVIYDKKSYILYRQHEKNTHGIMVDRKSLFLHRIKQLKKRRGEVYEQIAVFQKTIPLSAEQREMTEKVLNYQKSLFGKWQLLKDRRIGRQSKKQKIVYIGLILLGKL